MKTICPENQCTGCMACKDVCSCGAVSVRDHVQAVQAVIDEKVCVGCSACERICPVNCSPQRRKPVRWQQGWALDPEIRKKSSSGGAAAVLEREFVRTGGYVCSCVFSKGRFEYRIGKTEEDIRLFSGSKYVKSDPTGIYQQVKELLKNGKKVLFVGLPCHVAAMIRVAGEALSERLYTIDLICHGSPSPQILDLFFKQHGRDLAGADHVSFRDKNRFYIDSDGKTFTVRNCQDAYSMGFLYSLFYTENCYACSYASVERISDITLGDAWGSELPDAEQRKGISLILCQTAKGKELLSVGGMHLQPVDIQKAMAANRQLCAPASVSTQRAYFFDQLKNGAQIDRIVKKCYPKPFRKQKLKGVLLTLKLKK